MAQLQPQSVFDCFAQINKVPRPSKREEKITAFLRKFGEDLGLETLVDEAGNVLIRKPGTPGYENRKTVILQSHQDMVCEKNKDVEFDFDNDAIQTYVDGDWLKAKGTTLAPTTVSASPWNGTAASHGYRARPDRMRVHA